MHLALFLHALSTGGAQRRSIMLANGLAARGHRVDLITAVSGGPQASLVSGKVNLIALSATVGDDVAAGGARTGELMKAIGPLAAYLRKDRPDMLVAMANHAVIPASLARMLSLQRHTRLVLRASNHLSRKRGARLSLRRLPETWLWRQADGVLAVSDDVAADVCAVTGFAPERVAAVTSPILPDNLPAMPTRRPPTGSANILAMGRFVRQKGFDTLLTAFAHLLRERDATLTLVGDGPDLAALRDLAGTLGILRHVRFPGLVDNPFDHFAQADLFALSSRWEGMPGVLVEAIAMGCPVVSTDCPGGSRELLLQGALGPLVPVDDPVALAGAMEMALRHPVSPDRLRQRALAFTLTNATLSYEQALLAFDAAHHRSPGTKPVGQHEGWELPTE